jgi:SAM-dependent methyltransferase
MSPLCPVHRGCVAMSGIAGVAGASIENASHLQDLTGAGSDTIPLARLRFSMASLPAKSLALLAVLFSLLAPPAQPAQTTQQSQQQRSTSTPYQGDLSIFEYADRDQKLHIDRVMDLLEVAPGKSVADIGAGSGWFTVRAAARVSPSGQVYAEDINPDAVDYIKIRAAKQNLANVHTILGEVDDTRLPPSSVDAVLILKTYHEFAHPIPLMKRLRASLKPAAKIGIIDRNGNGTDHGIMPGVVEREMAQAGYHRIGKYDFTKDDGQDYFLIFTAN